MPLALPLQPPQQGSTGPASPPTGNPGLAAAGMSKVREAVKLLEMGLQDLPLGSDPHKVVADCIAKLSKGFPPSEEVPGIQATQLRALQEKAQQSAPMAALMRSMQQQQQPAQPGAGMEG